jgi:hypothetical protein
MVIFIITWTAYRPGGSAGTRLRRDRLALRAPARPYGGFKGTTRRRVVVPDGRAGYNFPY